MIKRMGMIVFVLGISIFFIVNALMETPSQSNSEIRLYLSDFTHAGGYWKHGCSDDQVMITEFIEETAKNEKTFFYTIYPRCAGRTFVWFEFYQSDDETPWFYIEYVVKISEELEISIHQVELVPCLENDYYILRNRPI